MEYFKELSKDFPKEAYSIDSSRGFDLTSLKAQYIKERLNEVFSIWGWSFEEKFQTVETGVLCFGKLTVYEFVPSSDKGEQIIHKTREVTACGFSQVKRNTGDQYKGASTDSLSKAASFIGIGNEVFKGNINLNTVSLEKGHAAGTVKSGMSTNINNNLKSQYSKFPVFGVCSSCNSLLNKSLKTGKIYCSNWKICGSRPFEDANAVVLPKEFQERGNIDEIKKFYKDLNGTVDKIQEAFASQEDIF